MAIFVFMVKVEPSFLWWWLHSELAQRSTLGSSIQKPSFRQTLVDTIVTERPRLTGTHGVVRSGSIFSVVSGFVFRRAPFYFLSVTYLQQYTTGVAGHEGRQ